MRYLLCTALVFLLIAPATGSAQRVQRPQGTYTTDGDRFLVVVAGRSIELAAFDFGCRETTGRTSINDISISKVRGRWRFSERTHGLVTYADDHPDENARVRLTGAFSANANRVTGRLRVTTRYCGTTKLIEWSATRSRRRG